MSSSKFIVTQFLTMSSQKGFPTIDLYFNRLTVTVLGFVEINNFKRLGQYISVMWKTDKYNMSCRKLLTDLKLIMNRLHPFNI